MSFTNKSVLFSPEQVTLVMGDRQMVIGAMGRVLSVLYTEYSLTGNTAGMKVSEILQVLPDSGIGEIEAMTTAGQCNLDGEQLQPTDKRRGGGWFFPPPRHRT